MKKLPVLLLIALAQFAVAQETYPVNGSLDKRPGLFAFTNATIVVNANLTIAGGTLFRSVDLRCATRIHQGQDYQSGQSAQTAIQKIL